MADRVLVTGGAGGLLDPSRLLVLANHLDLIVCDVRRRRRGGKGNVLFPYTSLKGWCRKELQRLLGERYLWVPELCEEDKECGGRRQLRDVQAGLRIIADALQDSTAQGGILVLCGCTDPKDCHRQAAAAAIAKQLVGAPVACSDVDATVASLLLATPPSKAVSALSALSDRHGASASSVLCTVPARLRHATKADFHAAFSHFGLLVCDVCILNGARTVTVTFSDAAAAEACLRAQPGPLMRGERLEAKCAMPTTAQQRDEESSSYFDEREVARCLDDMMEQIIAGSRRPFCLADVRHDDIWDEREIGGFPQRAGCMDQHTMLRDLSAFHRQRMACYFETLFPGGELSSVFDAVDRANPRLLRVKELLETGEARGPHMPDSPNNV